MLNLIKILIINLFLTQIFGDAFRIQSSNGSSHCTHAVTPIRYRSSSLSLFGSNCSYLSKCKFLNNLCSRISKVADHVNNVVPGGLFTAITLPIVTTAVIRRYFSSGNEKIQAPLHRYQCTGCGFIIFPAKNREDKFFSPSFTCPNCGAPKSRFVEKNKN